MGIGPAQKLKLIGKLSARIHVYKSFVDPSTDDVECSEKEDHYNHDLDIPTQFTRKKT